LIERSSGLLLFSSGYSDTRRRHLKIAELELLMVMSAGNGLCRLVRADSIPSHRVRWSAGAAEAKDSNGCKWWFALTSSKFVAYSVTGSTEKRLPSVCLVC
jgi:hypothetical protein